jgi:hypothetical protein
MCEGPRGGFVLLQLGSLNLGGLPLKISPCMKPCKYVADTKAVTEARDCKGLSQGKQLTVREQSLGQSSRVPN